MISDPPNPTLFPAPCTRFPAVCPRNGDTGQAGGLSTGCASPGTSFMLGRGWGGVGKKVARFPDICRPIPSLGGQRRLVERAAGAAGKAGVSERVRNRGEREKPLMTKSVREGPSGKTWETRQQWQRALRQGQAGGSPGASGTGHPCSIPHRPQECGSSVQGSLTHLFLGRPLHSSGSLCPTLPGWSPP